MTFERLVATELTPEEKKEMEEIYRCARTHMLEADVGKVNRKQRASVVPAALPKAIYPTYGAGRISWTKQQPDSPRCPTCGQVLREGQQDLTSPTREEPS